MDNIYCNNCGKSNSKASKFCKSCGAEIKRVSVESTGSNLSINEASSLNSKNTNTKQKDKKVKAGLTGWLALVGLGLIVAVCYQGYGLFQYLPLLNQNFDLIPGFMTVLQVELIMSILMFLLFVYLLFLYFKKNIKFPKYYIISLIATVVYYAVDLSLFNSLIAPTPELQKILTDSVSETSTNFGRSIIFGIIWILYMLKSKQVKATFVNN